MRSKVIAWVWLRQNNSITPFKFRLVWFKVVFICRDNPRRNIRLTNQFWFVIFESWTGKGKVPPSVFLLPQWKIVILIWSYSQKVSFFLKNRRTLMNKVTLVLDTFQNPNPSRILMSPFFLYEGSVVIIDNLLWELKNESNTAGAYHLWKINQLCCES